MSDYRFDDCTVDASESFPVILDLFPICANFWRSNEPISAAEYVRPTKATGFAYQAGSAGLTAEREPRWPTALSQTAVDGSITWTTVAASSNGVNVLSSPAAISEQSGLTISNVAVSENTKITATYSGGTVGQSYDVLYTFTLNGLTRKARQRVNVTRL